MTRVNEAVRPSTHARLKAEDEEVARVILDACESRSDLAPESYWHPKFGWVLFKGRPTQTSALYLEWVKKLEVRNE